MKYIYTIFMVVIVTAVVFAQAPEKMTYQAVVRNSSNELMTNRNIGMQVSILQGSSSGTAVYVERHFPTTNANGLVTIEVGDGTVVNGDFSSIDWGQGPYFIKTEIDVNGGANYTITGTSELLSVPYALYAKNVQNDKVNDADHDITNEIQTITLTDNQLSLSKGGGSVFIPEESPWSKDGDDIYRREGTVSIGTDKTDGELTISTNLDNSITIENNFNKDIGLAAGVNVTMFGSSKATRVGVYNFIRATGTGNQTSVFNLMIEDADANKMGVNNIITGKSSKKFYGTSNSINGSGNGDKYGTYNVIEKMAGGTHYAVYGEAEKEGSYAGYFKGDVYVSQKVKTPATGEANMIPVAYGRVYANGTLVTGSSTPNVTEVDKTGTGRYIIKFSNITINRGNYVVILTSASVDPTIFSYGVDPITRDMIVLAHNLDGDSVDGFFNFVIYKGPGD